MFARLTGKAERLDNEKVIVDVMGVGYLVSCSERSLKHINGDTTKLFIETIVREDSISLYGFIDAIEQQWFNLLITVKGVGPKLALTILSSVELSKLSNDVMTQNKSSLSKISGIGPKTADRLIVELKDKVSKVFVSHTEIGIEENNSTIDVHDSISALIALGYNKAEAGKIVMKVVAQNDNLSVREIIRLSLRELAK